MLPEDSKGDGYDDEIKRLSFIKITFKEALQLFLTQNEISLNMTVVVNG